MLEPKKSADSTSTTSPSKVREVDYAAMLLKPRDVAKANRLVRARQNAVKSVKSVLAFFKCRKDVLAPSHENLEINHLYTDTFDTYCITFCSE